VTLRDAWERNASSWITWAREQGHDGFWDATWPALRSILPPPGGLVVEIGCGEGRVGREMLALGHTVVGVEQSVTLVRAARTADGPLTVVRADAARLPLRHGAAATVVACMSLHDVDDLEATIAEAARILRTGGHFCVAMVHPFASAQEPATMHTYAPVVSDSYLRERTFVDHAERDGLTMDFVSRHRPLGTYLNAFANAGLVLRTVVEIGKKPIPWLLVAGLEKPSSPRGSGNVRVSSGAGAP
jgi:SAM-dependent methyltransferase